jgi:8-oxo-dGTP pyrophosphatase MutT (NUDIX family)
LVRPSDGGTVTAEADRAAVAEVLRGIPAETESAASLREICVAAGVEPAAAGHTASALAAMLGVTGAVRATTVDGDVLVKAETSAARLFLASLAEYVANGHTVLDNWTRAGTVDPPYNDQDVLVGSQFLYLMERRRIRLDPDAPTLRRIQVAKVVIKSHRRGGGYEYLVIHDAAARQYQLPGGSRRHGDGDLQDVAIRELQEELSGYVFDPARDRLVPLGVVDVAEVSRTSGAYTTYELSLFHMASTRTSLGVQPNARWVPESAIFAGAFAGQSLNNIGLPTILETMPGGISGLGASLRPSSENRLVVLSRTRPLEFWGFVIGAVSLVLSVVFYFLTEMS